MNKEDEMRNFIRKFQIIVYKIIRKIDNFINFIKRIKPIPQILKIFSPGCTRCSKCELTWKYCKEKCIPVNEHYAIFATCDYCWKHSTLDELKKIYTDFYYEQLESSRIYGYNLVDSLDEFLEHVQREYYSKYSENEYKRIIRKQKLENIINEKSLK